MGAKLKQSIQSFAKRAIYEEDKKIYQSLSIKQKTVRLKAKKLLWQSAYSMANDEILHDYAHNH